MWHRAILVLGLGNVVQAGVQKVIDVDFYRAMGDGDSNKFTEENDDVADMTGVIKYVHTEVIAEHIIGNPTRTMRKYGIDVIVRWRFKVMNTDALLQNAGHNVDFGNFLAFDLGQDTDVSLNGDHTIMQYGDYVGVQNQVDARYPTMGPFYWLSISGFCPNLPWMCTRGYYPQCSHPVSPTARCKLETPCPGKGNRTVPSEKCLRYDSTGDVAMGGLCDEVDETKLPTGTFGCVYNYLRSSVKKVMLDDIVGLTDKECKGGGDDPYKTRKCKDFLDFRKHCTDASMRRMFSGDGTIQNNVGFCVEYDIHPKCVNNCTDPGCVNLPPEQKEVGMPFWFGRCDALANQKRHEQFAARFGIYGATDEHKNTQADILANPVACGGRGYSAGNCNPDGSGLTGGPYCHRGWSGICTMCYIPGTKSPYPNKDHDPICPTDILRYPEYRDQGVSPSCKSADPDKGTLLAKDLCCLYTQQCTTQADPKTAPFDANGFAIAWSNMTSQALIDWFGRFVNSGKTPYVSNMTGLQEIIYWLWMPGQLPQITEKDFEDGGKVHQIMDQIKDFYSATSLAPTAAPTPPPTADPPEPKSNFPVVQVSIGAAAVVVLGCIVGIFVVMNQNKRRREAEAMMLQDHAGAGTSLPTR